MKTACANPGCPNRTSALARRFGRAGAGLERDGSWFCSLHCLAAVLAESALTARRRGLLRTERRIKLGLLLLKNNLIERDKLAVALEQKGHSLKKLGEILVEAGYVTEKDLGAALAVQAGIAQVSLDPGLAVRLRDVVPYRLLAEFGCVVFNHDEDSRDLSVAVHDAEAIPYLEQFFVKLLPDHRVRFFLEERRKIGAILKANFPGEKARPEGEGGEGDGENRAEELIMRFIGFLNTLPAGQIKVDNLDRSIWVKAVCDNLKIDIYFTRE